MVLFIVQAINPSLHNNTSVPQHGCYWLRETVRLPIASKQIACWTIAPLEYAPIRIIFLTKLRSAGILSSFYLELLDCLP